eukprot:1159235-Pelagomonas_calceolata.AAC.19
MLTVKLSTVWESSYKMSEARVSARMRTWRQMQPLIWMFVMGKSFWRIHFAPVQLQHKGKWFTPQRNGKNVMGKSR